MFRQLYNQNTSRSEEVPYPSILALRILLLRKLRPKAFSTFQQLATLLKQWKATPGWLEGQAETVALIREKLELRIFEEEEILEVKSSSTVFSITCQCQVSAALSTNAFSKYLDPVETGDCGERLGKPAEEVGTSIRVVFLLAAMPAHSCLPNAEQAIHGLSEGLQLELRATRLIREGSQVQISYTDLLAPTPVRQFELMNSKLFLCACPRCEDPTEMDTYASGVKCSACLRAQKGAEPGILLPMRKQEAWQCGKCEATIPNGKVLTLLFKICEQMEALMNNPSEGPTGLEAFLTKFSRVLADGNGLLQRVRYSLCGQYGRLPGFQLSQLSSAQLERKLHLCESMLATLDKLQPGRSSRRAMILYELHISLLVTGQTQGRKEMLTRSVICLKEAVDLLRDEPPASFGGQLFIGGSASLPQVEKFVSEL